MTSHVHHVACTCRQAGCPYEYMAYQKILIDLLFTSAKQYLSKLTASHFSILNMKIANWHELKRMDICRGICMTSVQAVDFIRPVVMVLSQLQI